MPPRSVVTSTFCPLTRYINPYYHFIVLVFGESHNNCEAEIKHMATMGSRELIPGLHLPDRNIITFVFSVRFTLEQTTKAQRGSRGIEYFFNLGA
jgi:hypothetical protein